MWPSALSAGMSLAATYLEMILPVAAGLSFALPFALSCMQYRALVMDVQVGCNMWGTSVECESCSRAIYNGDE